MLRARSALRHELAGLEHHVRQLAQEDPVCRRLISMPGIGAVVALTYRSAADDPNRFASSKKVGPWAGLTLAATCLQIARGDQADVVKRIKEIL